MAIILSCNIGVSQSLNSLNVPTGHPRLFWNPTSLAIAQNWYTTNNFPVSGAPALTIYQGDEAVDLALKYVLSEGIDNATTRHGYARKAIDWANLALDEIQNVPYDSATGAGTCNECRWYMEQMLLVIDWCFDELYPGEWDDYYNTLNTVIPQWNNATWGNPTQVLSNFNHGYARQNIEWGLMIYHENPTLAQDLLDNGINQRWNNFVNYTNTDGVSGVPSEGTSYAYTILTYHLYSGISLANAGYDYFNETDYFKKAIAHTIYNTTPNPSYLGPNASSTFVLPYPYGDAGAFMNLGPWSEPLGAGHTAFMLMSAYIHQGIGDLPAYAKNWVETHGRYNINIPVPLFVRSITDQLPTKSLSDNPLDYFSPDGGGNHPYGYSRTSWTDPDASSIFVQMGKAPLGGHEHFDAGSFTIAKGDRYLVIPPSGRGYGSGWRIPDYDGALTPGIDVNYTIAKNSMLFGLEGSVAGGKSTGSIDRLQSHSEFFYTANDLTSNYKYDLNPTDINFNNEHCKSFTREFIFLKKLETSIIFDRTESESSQDETKTNLVHTQNQPILTGTDKYTVTNGNYEAVINVMLPSNKTIDIIDEEVVTGYTPREDEPYRLQIENNETGVVYFLNVIQAKSVGEADVAINLIENDSVIRLELSHPVKGYAVVEFEKGIVSQNGQIGCSTTGIPSTLTDLNSGAQAITVTDDGPEWSVDQYVELNDFNNMYNSCSLNVYENEDNIMFNFPEDISGKVHLTFYDLSGKIVLTNYCNLSDAINGINVSDLQSNNLYIVDYKSDECSGAVKFVKR